MMKVLQALSFASFFLTATAIAGSGVSDKPHWDYKGSNGPAHWGEMHSDWAIAKDGKEQSPIDLQGAVAEDLPEIQFFYKPTPLEIVNNGHTVQVNYQPGSKIRVGDESFDLLQFHFHAPSEHTVEGSHFGMEMHLVHKNDEGELGVVGVFLVHGKTHPLISEIWKYAPRKAGPAKLISGVMVDASDLLPKDRHYYAYPGSLTTPPCSEGVSWHVIKEPVEVGTSQILSFRKLIGMNARPVQPLHDRQLKVSE